MTVWISVVALLAGCRNESDTFEQVAVERIPGELHLPSRSLDYGTVALHDTVEQELVLSNVGAGVLYIHDLQFSDDRLRVHWSIPSEVALTLDPGQITLVPIAFSPRDIVDPTVILRVLSSDPSFPTQMVELTASITGTPTLRLEPDSLDFGQVQVGQHKTLDVVLSNLGNDTLTIDSVSLDAQEGFELLVDPSGTSLSPGQSNGLASVIYTPVDAGGHTGLLVFGSTDPDRPEIALILTGSGTNR
jgi:hypothetical protein